jgi:hypothetical protein
MLDGMSVGDQLVGIGCAIDVGVAFEVVPVLESASPEDDGTRQH